MINLLLLTLILVFWLVWGQSSTDFIRLVESLSMILSSESTLKSLLFHHYFFSWAYSYNTNTDMLTSTVITSTNTVIVDSFLCRSRGLPFCLLCCSCCLPFSSFFASYIFILKLQSSWWSEWFCFNEKFSYALEGNS